MVKVTKVTSQSDKVSGQRNESDEITGQSDESDKNLLVKVTNLLVKMKKYWSKVTEVTK